MHVVSATPVWHLTNCLDHGDDGQRVREVDDDDEEETVKGPKRLMGEKVGVQTSRLER